MMLSRVHKLCPKSALRIRYSNQHALRSGTAKYTMSTFVQTQVETGTTTLPRISSAVKELLSQCKNAAPAHESLTDGSTYRSYEPDIDEVVVLYDLDAIDGCLDSVTSAFVKSYHGVNASKQPLQDPAIVHCFAIKSCPLSGILEYMVDRGYGLETASVGEVQQALASGCKPENVMFDSPCKSTSDIEYALRAGVHMNANSLQEVEKIKGVIESMKRHDVEVKGTVGLRVNPLVGGGKIAALSTATASSKFGVPIASSEDKVTAEVIGDDVRNDIISTYVNNPWLNAIMCHVGSQGMALEKMVDGAVAISALADEIDEACKVNGEANRRITLIDIGGGLSANYLSEEVSPTFADYATMLAEKCPNIFNQERRLITEFGKALIAKTGAIVAKIEDVLVEPGGEHVTAVTHAGADLLLRTAYCPEKFPHRLRLLSKEGSVKGEEAGSIDTTVAGPLCFSGDIVASHIAFPKCAPGDRCVVMDAGANTVSLHSRHCSRQAPSVYTFREEAGAGGVKLECIRAKETVEETMRFWARPNQK